MPIFNFTDESYLLGDVREVDTRKVAILVNSDSHLRKARVGQLVTIQLSGGSESWQIGLIEKVIKSVVAVDASATEDDDADESHEFLEEAVVNTVRLTLMGCVRWSAIDNEYKFSRSLDHVPEIDSTCHILKDANLESFMGVIADGSDPKSSLELGVYKLDESAKAYVDGNKLFQRHAALLGSTGSGKSWTVASILERSSKLPSSNIVVFDLHGEYRELSYARKLRIPGPDEDVSTSSENLLYLPYWLLNTEELQSLFIDGSEFSAHNQVMAFQDAVTAEKKKTLTALNKDDVLRAFTLDSPIPFQIQNVVDELERLNTEQVPGASGRPKNGPFFGQFTRLLIRLRSKCSDRRYGFLFNGSDSVHEYSFLASLVEQLMGYGIKNSNIKVIDFSEVPSDILPVIVGLVARLIYQIQFWTLPESRQPIAFVCDEAHLYLPRQEGSPVQKRAVAAFEKIAKEGRKYGVSLMIVSQRPSDVSSTILSQCNNVVSLRLTNAEDQSTVRKMLPESLDSLLEALPVMDIGEAMVVGDAVLLPSRIKITPPNEQPLSATVDFWSRWQEDNSSPDFTQIVENLRRQSRVQPATGCPSE